jgi:hypothetical protein
VPCEQLPSSETAGSTAAARRLTVDEMTLSYSVETMAVVVVEDTEACGNPQKAWR